MKRICRQHGISRWPSRKINKVNRSISQLKQVIESVEVPEIALNLNPPICPRPVAPGAESLPLHLDRASVARQEDNSNLKTLEPVGCHTSSSSKTKSSSQGTMNAPISQAPNDGSQHHEPCGIEQPFSANSEHFASVSNLLEDQNTGFTLLLPTDVVAEPDHDHADADILIEDSASSKSVRNPPSTSTSISEPKTVIIKARYKEDIIRFRLAKHATIAALYEKISKRLMLGVGAFDLKYLDDDHDWVKLSCDEDLQECLEISATSGSSVIRLAVQDICVKAPPNVLPGAGIL